MLQIEPATASALIPQQHSGGPWFTAGLPATCTTWTDLKSPTTPQILHQLHTFCQAAAADGSPQADDNKRVRLQTLAPALDAYYVDVGKQLDFYRPQHPLQAYTYMSTYS